MKNKLLMAVDIGNTNITCAFFKDEDVVCSFRMTTQLARTSDEYGVYIREMCIRDRIRRIYGFSLQIKQLICKMNKIYLISLWIMTVTIVL